MEHRTLKQKPTQRAGPQESKGIAFTEGVERGMGDMGLIRLSQQHWVINQWDVSSGRSRGVSCAFWGEIHGGGGTFRGLEYWISVKSGRLINEGFISCRRLRRASKLSIRRWSLEPSGY